MAYTIANETYRRSVTKIAEIRRIALDKCDVLDGATKDYCIAKVTPNADERRRIAGLFDSQRMDKNTRYCEPVLAITSGKIFEKEARIRSKLYLRGDHTFICRGMFNDTLSYIKENRHQARLINQLAKEYELLNRLVPLNCNIYDVFYDSFIDNINDEIVRRHFKKHHYECSVRHMMEGSNMDPSFQKMNVNGYKNAYVFYLFLEIFNKEIDVLYSGKTMNPLFNQKTVNEVINFLNDSKTARDNLFYYRTFVMGSARSKADPGFYVISR